MADFRDINYLYHHGIKGQKWGIRRYQNEDGTLTEEGKRKYGNKPNAIPYSNKQYSRDKKVYGTFAANRINKSTLNGEQVSGARSKEADRINSFRTASNISGKIGSVIGAILGAYGAYRIGKKIPSTGNTTLDGMLAASISTGGSVVSSFLARKGGQTIPMLIGGYPPSKKR